MHRKVLILSHNPIGNTDNMGKTMQNIFSCFPKEELCQLYIRNQEPSFNTCKEYFYIDEVQMIKSIFNKKTDTGFEVQQINNNTVKIEDSKYINIKQAIYNFGRRRNQLIYMSRNFLWRHGNWFSDSLKRWIENQKPTCIFFMAGDYSFLFDIALFLSKTYNLPLFSYYVDEFYFVKRSQQLCSFEGRIYQKHFKSIYMYSKMNFCISESMCKAYNEEFGKQSELLMNTVSSVNNFETITNINKKTLKMTYMGNISYNRWKSLSKLSSAIEKLNIKNDKKIQFSIYSSEKNKKLLKKLTSNKDVKFCGSLNSQEVENKIKESDILVHVESFDKLNKEKVKYSLSTKIPDLLNSGKIILLFGPEGIEPIDYLKRNNAAYVLTNEDKLLEDLEMLYSTNFNYSQYLKNAKMLLLKNHLNSINKGKIKKYL